MQSISCRKEPRLLRPVGRLDPLYQELLLAHQNKEGVFDDWRDRYNVAGTSQPSNPKRQDSLGAQQLRASAALLLDWFRACLRQGRLGEHTRRNPNEPEQRYGGEDRVRRLRAFRRDAGLSLPRGAQAVALGIVGLSPHANAPPDDDPPF